MLNLFKNFAIILFLASLVVSCGEKAEPILDDDKSEIAPEQTEDDKISQQESEITNPSRGYRVEIDDMVYGNRDSSVVMVVYYSPTCPYCVYFHKNIFPELKKKYIDTGKIAYISREFIGNKQDLDASILARCNGSLDSYDKFVQLILEQQSSWAFKKNYRELLTNFAALGGISQDKYYACLVDKKIKTTLLDNTKLITKEANFIGTPSFFVNGVQYSGTFTIEKLSERIDQALENGNKQI